MPAERAIADGLLRDVADAPPVFKRLAQIVGWRATASFGIAFASTRVYFPTSRTVEGHPIAWCVGRAAAQRLAESEFAGRRVEVPRYFRKKAIHLRIVEGAKAGIPTSVLAAQNNVSLSAAQKIIARG